MGEQSPPHDFQKLLPSFCTGETPEITKDVSMQGALSQSPLNLLIYQGNRYREHQFYSFYYMSMRPNKDRIVNMCCKEPYKYPPQLNIPVSIFECRVFQK
ncbi:hypothetical protein CDAR_181011 [Caerostris darwini]|uniref:Uncharacterized protein n=1 Tax=Caerostris darwini TaxID=1538125 RepID=A0AAV4U3N7_9ARAC|nr:hypothetical protein CDAR_181011 [Caerostris darwini]